MGFNSAFKGLIHITCHKTALLLISRNDIIGINVVIVWGYMWFCSTFVSNGPFGARSRLWVGRLGNLCVIPRRGKKNSCYPKVSFSGLSGHFTDCTSGAVTSILYWRITGVLHSSSSSLGTTVPFFECFGLLNIYFPLIAILDASSPVL